MKTKWEMCSYMYNCSFEARNWKPSKLKISRLSCLKNAHIWEATKKVSVTFPGFCSRAYRSAGVPQVTNVCLWATGKTYYFSYSMFIQCWAPRILWLGTLGLLIIFPKLWPSLCCYFANIQLHVIVFIILWNHTIWDCQILLSSPQNDCIYWIKGNLNFEVFIPVTVIEGPRARTSPWFFGHFWKCSKIADFWHVGFVLPEKHSSENFFAGLLFIFEK